MLRKEMAHRTANFLIHYFIVLRFRVVKRIVVNAVGDVHGEVISE